MDHTIQVYVTNLSRYDYDGVIIAAWFTLPVSLDELRETHNWKQMKVMELKIGKPLSD